MSQFFALHQNSMHFMKTFLKDVYIHFVKTKKLYCLGQ